MITWSEKLAAARAALAPSVIAKAAAANRLLPAAADHEETRGFSGWQSTSAWAPSRLTPLSERAATWNNELP